MLQCAYKVNSRWSKHQAFNRPGTCALNCHEDLDGVCPTIRSLRRAPNAHLGGAIQSPPRCFGTPYEHPRLQLHSAMPLANPGCSSGNFRGPPERQTPAFFATSFAWQLPHSDPKSINRSITAQTRASNASLGGSVFRRSLVREPWLMLPATALTLKFQFTWTAEVELFVKTVRFADSRLGYHARNRRFGSRLPSVLADRTPDVRVV